MSIVICPYHEFNSNNEVSVALKVSLSTDGCTGASSPCGGASALSPWLDTFVRLEWVLYSLKYC